jgi:alcohol dehydrogenase (cytochrome c)
LPGPSRSPYSPDTRWMYIATSNECDVFTSSPQPYRAGHDFLGSVYIPDPIVRPTGALQALDPITGEKKWEFQYFSNPNGGALSTAGGLVFAGDSDGNFIVIDARTGKDLWHLQLGAAIYSTAITCKVDGKQYVVLPAGSAFFAFAVAHL